MTEQERMRWLDGNTNSVDMSLSKLKRESWKPGILQFMESQRIRQDWPTERHHHKQGVFPSYGRQAEILKSRSRKALNKNQRGFPGGKMVENLPANAGDTVSTPVSRLYILSLCLFNTYAEYIMQNARLHKAQAGINPTFCKATRPMQHTMTELMCSSYWSPRTWSPSSTTREATAMRSPCTATRAQPLLAGTRQSQHKVMKTQCSQK